MFKFKNFKLSKYSLNLAWKWIVIGLIILPLIPSLGELSLGLALISIWLREYKHLIHHPLTWSLGLFSLWLIITSYFAYQPREAFLGLANVLPFFALFMAFRLVIRQVKQLFIIAWLIILLSIPIVIIGLGQLFLGWSIPELLSAIIGWRLVAQGIPEGRMSSVFIYANILAIYLLIVFILSLGLWFNSYQICQKKGNREIILKLIFLSIVVILNAIGLVLTSSRNAWAIALFACVIFAIYLSWYWLIGLVTLVVSSVFWASFGPIPGQELMRKIIPAYFWERLSDKMYQDRPLATLRTTQWHFCWEMTGDRPWLGWGLRNFSPLYKAETGIYLGHPHNLFLMFSAETGIGGVLCLSAIVGWVFFQALKAINQLSKNNRQEAQLILFTYVVAFGSCVLFNLFDVTIFDLRVNTMGWLLLACISGVSASVIDNAAVNSE
jgi:O-antigen ligase